MMNEILLIVVFLLVLIANGGGVALPDFIFFGENNFGMEGDERTGMSYSS